MIVFVVSPSLQPPFCGGNCQKIQQKIIKDKIKLPGFLSSDAHALLKGVISSPPNIFPLIILDQIHHHLKVILLFAT